jgi:L-fuculose-phosphate aldolase
MPKLKYLELREKVIETCLRMNEEGINQGTSGNVSVRTPEGFLMTASGIPYLKMKPEHIVEMDLKGGYIGDYLPSTEWRMHMDIFRHRREANAVVHTHSIYATALSCLRKDVPAFHYMIGIAGGTTLRCATYAEYGTQGLSDAMLKAMKDRTACLLANHGQIAFGDDLENALWRAGEVETLCHQYWAALQAGKPVILSDRLMTTVLARFKTYGKQPGQLNEGDAPSVIGPVRRDAPKQRVLAARRKGRKKA